MQDQEDGVQAQREADMAGARTQAARKTWFFERQGDGSIIAMEEREAWELVNSRSRWRRRDFKLIGVSDGTTYQRVIREMRVVGDALKPELDQMEKDLSTYKGAEERLLVEQAVDMDGDPSDVTNEENKQKVIRLRTIMQKLQDKLDTKQAEYRAATRDVNKQAFDAELEVARGHIEWPGEMNIITPEASPGRRKKIIDLLGGRGD